MTKLRRMAALAVLTLILLTVPAAPTDARSGNGAYATRLAAGLGSGSGSTIGPDGALYVTQPSTGTVSRIDRRTGRVSTFVSGLPAAGVMDVIFRHGTAYVLVTVIPDDATDFVGIYRVTGPTSFTRFANLGAFSAANPPDTDYFVPTGVPFAMENVPGGFLVTDGHHNRVLRVSLAGIVSELVAFENIVPTGLEVLGGKVWMAQAGPIPHLPQDGKVVSFGLRDPHPGTVATGGRLLVDVEFGRGAIYALAQGVWPVGTPEGTPANPDTGQLLRVDRPGFDVVARGLDRPTSLEILGNTAYIVTLDGEVWTVNLSGRHHRR